MPIDIVAGGDNANIAAGLGAAGAAMQGAQQYVHEEEENRRRNDLSDARIAGEFARIARIDEERELQAEEYALLNKQRASAAKAQKAIAAGMSPESANGMPAARAAFADVAAGLSTQDFERLNDILIGQEREEEARAIKESAADMLIGATISEEQDAGVFRPDESAQMLDALGSGTIGGETVIDEVRERIQAASVQRTNTIRYQRTVDYFGRVVSEFDDTLGLTEEQERAVQVASRYASAGPGDMDSDREARSEFGIAFQGFGQYVQDNIVRPALEEQRAQFEAQHAQQRSLIPQGRPAGPEMPGGVDPPPVAGAAAPTAGAAPAAAQPEWEVDLTGHSSSKVVGGRKTLAVAEQGNPTQAMAALESLLRWIPGNLDRAASEGAQNKKIVAYMKRKFGIDDSAANIRRALTQYVDR